MARNWIPGLLLSLLLSCLFLSVSTEDAIPNEVIEQFLTSNHHNETDFQNVQCDYIHKINASFQCLFVKRNIDCNNIDGLINYLSLIYCQLSLRLRPLALAILGVSQKYSMLYSSYIIFKVNNLLLTTVDTMATCTLYTIGYYCRRLNSLTTIYGVTLLAFGNGAPDIFSAIAATTSTKSGGSGLAVGALCGAGMFVTSIIVGTIGFRHNFTVTRRPFYRDLLFYVAGVSLLFYILYYGHMKIAYSLGFIGLYIVYVLVVCISRYIRQMSKSKRELNRQSDIPNPVVAPVGNELIGEVSEGDGEQMERADIPNDTRRGNDAIPNLDGLTGLTKALAATEILGTAMISHDNPPLVANEIEQDEIENSPNFNNHELRDSEDDCLIGFQTPSSSSSRQYKREFKTFLKSLLPFNWREWKESKIIAKIFTIIKLPLLICLNLTTPTIDYEMPKNNWNKWRAAVQCILAPLFCSVVTKGGFKMITAHLPVWLLVLAIGLLLAVIVILTTTNEKPPRYHTLFAFFGFTVSVLWIYATANEIVDILQSFGLVLGISSVILGITVLAWANCIGDFVSNTVVANQGFPRMAMSACYGSPMMSIFT
ncbi:Sodium/potassium/calcium exchanger 6, mitochondrial [Trichoplax sp. H2]|nr:Sodium/potassium/calcium exchanger 6, mitochondrial [Trichoplax sp. H2]|eukprot:RDD40731.1 Sodium/potassium/calcium exchanger 6, mitochondrial [Trichoplax sp. H2]